MKINDELYLQKKAFIAKMSELLNMAKPHLTCEFKLGEEINKDQGGEYVVVTAKNGYTYKVDVTCDSLACVAEEVFRAMVCK